MKDRRAGPRLDGALAVVLVMVAVAVAVYAAPRALSPRVSPQEAERIALREVGGGDYTAASQWWVAGLELRYTGSRVLESDGTLGGPTVAQWDRLRRVWLVELEAPPQGGLLVNRAAVLVDADSGTVFEVVTSSDSVDGSLKS